MSELPQEHTQVQQCHGEQRGAQHWVCLAARYRQVCPQCRILYTFLILNETENWSSQCFLVIVTLMCVAGWSRVKTLEWECFEWKNMKWFISICTRFQWHPECIQRNMQNKAVLGHTVLWCYSYRYLKTWYSWVSQAHLIFSPFLLCGECVHGETQHGRQYIKTWITGNIL